VTSLSEWRRAALCGGISRELNDEDDDDVTGCGGGGGGVSRCIRLITQTDTQRAVGSLPARRR